MFTAKELSEDEERRLALRSLFSARGFPVFREDVQTLLSTYQAEIESLLKYPISTKEHDKLNYDLGVKSGISKVLALIESLEDEATS